MDPSACFERLTDALAAREKDEAEEAARDLMAWLDRGGFVPDTMLNVFENRTPREAALTYLRGIIATALSK